MTEMTYERRLEELIAQVRTHPLRDEIIRLALEQSVDDQNSGIMKGSIW